MSAQWTTDPTLNTGAVVQGENVDPIANADSAGATIISFRFYNGSAYGVGIQKVDPNGFALWGGAGFALNSSDNSQTSTTVYDAAVDANGNGIVVYEDSRSGNYDVYASKVFANGQSAWGASGVTLSIGAGYDLNPRVIAMPDSSCIFAWQSDDSTGIYLQRVNAAGNKMWGANGVFYHYQPGELLHYWTYPTLVRGTDSTFIMLYRKANASFNASQQGLSAMKFDLNGQQKFVTPVNFQTVGKLGNILHLKTIPDNYGGAYMAWLDGRINNFNFDGFVQHLDANGNELFPVGGVRVSSSANTDQLEENIPLIFNGDFYAVYYNGVSNFIAMQRFDGAGIVQFSGRGQTIASTGSLSVNYQQLNAVAGQTGIVITYEEGLVTGAGSYYACKADAAGNSMWASTRVPVAIGVSSKSNSTLTEEKNGQAVLCWQDNRNTANEIFVQNINSNGSIGTGISIAIHSVSGIYPNPATNRISSKSFGSDNYQIKNLVGKIVLEVKAENNSINISELAEGTYFISSQNDLKAEKFIVVR